MFANSSPNIRDNKVNHVDSFVCSTTGSPTNISSIPFTSSSSSPSSREISIQLKQVTFFQKPILGGGNNAYEQSAEPLQLVYPTGSLGMGLPVNIRGENADINRTGIVALMSSPENDPEERSFNNSVLILYLMVALLNLVMTCLLYQHASVVDSSKVETNYHGNIYNFGNVKQERSHADDVHFGFTILLIFIGAISGVVKSSLGLSLFCYAMIVNFILGTQSLPYYVYAVRYLFDLFMVYIALILRTKYTPTFLPIFVNT